MNHSQLTMPFKRYQMQPVWRADRPQKGRYREFYQCDADVVGSKSLLNEVELVCIYAKVFETLKLPVEIRINNRKLLAALAALCGGEEQMIPITIAIDKLDKIGIEAVKKELSERGLSEGQISLIEQYLVIGGNNLDKLNALQVLLGHNEAGSAGLQELGFLLNHPVLQGWAAAAGQPAGTSTRLVLDPTLARGLNYYTGTIFEIKALDVQMGSIGGGGRYDDLTGLFGVPNVPGVGISFGVDRIYDVLEEKQLFPDTLSQSTRVLFFNMGEAESARALELAQELRSEGIATEVFHESQKFDKQFKYAEKKNIPYAVIIGSDELSKGTCICRNLLDGTQESLAQSALTVYFRG
jgi:histidyl-tRNA synthetase